jgi:hypothetical protein
MFHLYILYINGAFCRGLLVRLRLAVLLSLKGSSESSQRIHISVPMHVPLPFECGRFRRAKRRDEFFMVMLVGKVVYKTGHVAEICTVITTGGRGT